MVRGSCIIAFSVMLMAARIGLRSVLDFSPGRRGFLDAGLRSPAVPWVSAVRVMVVCRLLLRFLCVLSSSGFTDGAAVGTVGRSLAAG